MNNVNTLNSKKCSVKKYCSIFLLLLFVFIKTAEAQQDSMVVQDTLQETETNALYDAIIKTKPKSKVAKQIYSFIFSNPTDTSINNQIDPNVTIASLFEEHRGKIIREITVVPLPPFGYSVHNTSSLRHKVSNFGNSIHYTTRAFVIESNLLFKKGQAIDPRMMGETEVFIRNLRYINDVRIYIENVSDQEVDVFVVVQDVWSIGFHINKLSTGTFDSKIYDRNFLGFGNEFSLRSVVDKNLGNKFGLGVKYVYRNIRKTFIDSGLELFNDIASSNILFKTERPINPKLNIFGNIEVDIKKMHKSVYRWDSITATQHNKYAATLGWASKTSSTGRRFAVSAGYAYIDPSYKNVVKPDTVDYSNIKSQYFLLQFSLFKQNYYREHLMRSYSKTENMAYGYNLSAQLGYSKWMGYTSGFYMSLKGSAGKKYAIGSLFTEAVIASHFNKSGAYQGLMQIKFQYTTPLFNYIAKNKARGIFQIGYSKFLNPNNAFSSYLYFSDYSTMDIGGANKLASRGTEAFVINVEHNFFTRFNTLEFRYLVYTFFDIAWMKNKKHLFHSDNLFKGVGMGVRIRNELLVFKTVDIKFGWYPNFSKIPIGFGTSDPPISSSYTPKYPSMIID